MATEDTQGVNTPNAPESGNEDKPFLGVPPLLLGSSNRQYDSFQTMDEIPPMPQLPTPTPPPYVDAIPPADPQVTLNEAQTSARPPKSGDDITIIVESAVTEGKQAIDNQADQGETPHDPQDTDTVETRKIPDDSRLGEVKMFATETLPRLIYLHLLLRLPYLYFSRVERIFVDARLSMSQIRDMAIWMSATDEDPQSYLEDKRVPGVYKRLKNRWEELIEALMEEWRTLNLISVLLLGAIMTMFQIDGAAQDPITRYVAFYSLICALISLLHGCLFIVRFSTMRKVSKAAEWALEAQRYPNPFWNVWVMLSMPLFWLIWSIVAFVVCIMTFMWRSRARLPDDFVFSVPPSTETAARIVISVVLGVGMVYTLLILNTLSQYGSQMDEAWRKRINPYLRKQPGAPPGTRKTRWRAPRPHAAAAAARRSMTISPTTISTEVSEERKPSGGEDTDEHRWRVSADSRDPRDGREERKRQVRDSSDHRRRSYGSRGQDRQQQLQPRYMLGEIKSPMGSYNRQQGTMYQVDSYDGQQPQGFKSVAKAQGEVLEGTKGSAGNFDRRQGPEVRENEGSEAGRGQGIHFRVKEELEVLEGRKGPGDCYNGRQRSSERRVRENSSSRASDRTS